MDEHAAEPRTDFMKFLEGDEQHELKVINKEKEIRLAMVKQISRKLSKNNRA